jgi:hypothetical protein
VNIELALLADYAAVMKDNKLMAAGIFDQLRPLEMPWRHPTMFIALRVHLHPGEDGGHEIKVRLVDPDGREIVSLEAEADVLEVNPVEGANFQLVLSLNNVPFETYGRHAFDVFLDARYEYTIPLIVEKRPDLADTPGES